MKRNLSLLILVIGCIWSTQFFATGAQNTSSLLEQEFIRAEAERSARGLAMSPVPVSAGVGRTRFMIGLGSYLVNSACVSCHTNPTFQAGGNPFLGQPEKVNTTNFLAGGAPFGPFQSRNLTPDPKKDNLPGGLTIDEFKQTMRTGIDVKRLHPTLGPLLQVMPWWEFAKYSDRDLEAMYAYLRALPPAEPAPR